MVCQQGNSEYFKKLLQQDGMRMKYFTSVHPQHQFFLT